jgi:hypothetical protein
MKKEDAEMLNHWSRRDFFGSAGLLFFMGKQLVGAPATVSVEDAVAFIRQTSSQSDLRR